MKKLHEKIKEVLIFISNNPFKYFTTIRKNTKIDYFTFKIIIDVLLEYQLIDKMNETYFITKKGIDILNG